MKTTRSSIWFRPQIVFPSSFLRITALAAAAWVLGVFLPVVQAQNLPGQGPLAFSISGQFIVTGTSFKSPLQTMPEVVTNTSLVRLEQALLSVSAERIKQSLRRQLGIPSGAHWSGAIYLALHPAVWTDENVTVLSRPGDQGWSYVVQLPDVVQQARFMRAMTGVLLLELANRNAPPDGRSAEIPDWLIDGLSQQMQRDELADVVLSSPDRPLDNPQPRRNGPRERELDPLTPARLVLRKHPVLTFDQLSWPTADQLSGQDDGVYHASAQLFVAELLKLNDGPGRLQRMLASLPQCYNWQTALQNTWGDRFTQPLDLEKWWALAVVDFLSHDPGPAWTPAFSAGQLDALLTVPVEVRASSNSLPDHAEIPLQAVMHDFSAAQQSAIFETRLRDLRIAQFRMAPQFIALTDDYCRALADFLGERLGPEPRRSFARRAPPAAEHVQAGEIEKRLDALDVRRRLVEAGAPDGNVQTSARLNVQPAGAVNLKGHGSKL